MAEDVDFTQLSRSFEEIRQFARIEAEHGASETLIASAEYELEQIRKVLAGASPDPLPALEAEPEPAIEAPGPVTPVAEMSLVAKLRKRAREVSEHLPVLRLSA